MEYIPGAALVTTPVTGLIVAMVVLLLLHCPPGVASLNVVVAPPSQILVAPAIAAGNGFTITVAFPVIVTLQVVAALVATMVYTPAAVCISINVLPVPASLL